MKHIITGGSGFTGQVLAAKLIAEGEEVVIFDKTAPSDVEVAKAATPIHGDVRSAADLARLPLSQDDVVYHLAARQFADSVPARGRNEWFAEVNVDGTKNVIAAMQAASAHKLVFFSTDMTYGKPIVCPVPPTHPQNPLGPYGASRKEAERLLRAAPGLTPSIFRPRLITGPGRLGVLGKLFRLIKAGLPVPMIGSGANRYQMVGVEDCARAALLAVNAGCPPGPFNLGSEEPPTTRQLLQGIIDHARSTSILLPTPPAILKPVLGALDKIGATLLYPEQFEIADLDIMLNTSETSKVLGWRPERDDISMMIAAYEAAVAR
ncbi:NAD-dependent epimerase/dehydratase family protein [Agrobacterium pusense]|uniref:NAD-dependent epimerase/dehydratase family protein n=1 Tax=Agrobacterium pusense TaxID=648995 RepID=UPI000D38B23C|nr:NAD(P)-dependent oxidoreductase [Agrobacterium pusense]PTV77481.1 epimerase [Agrobacterium pusense]